MQTIEIKTENIQLPHYKLDNYNKMFRELKKQKLPKHQTFKQVLQEMK